MFDLIIIIIWFTSVILCIILMSSLTVPVTVFSGKEGLHKLSLIKLPAPIKAWWCRARCTLFSAILTLHEILFIYLCVYLFIYFHFHSFFFQFIRGNRNKFIVFFWAHYMSNARHQIMPDFSYFLFIFFLFFFFNFFSHREINTICYLKLLF